MSAAAVMLPDSRSSAEGFRLPMPTSEIVTVGSRSRRRCTEASSASCSAADAEPSTAGEGKKTASAPVARASRSMRRVALTCTLGLPTPPKSWTTFWATGARKAESCCAAANQVALHDDRPMTSPPVSVVSR